MKNKSKKDKLVEVMGIQLDNYKKLVYHFEGLVEKLDEEIDSLRERLYATQPSDN